MYNMLREEIGAETKHEAWYNGALSTFVKKNKENIHLKTLYIEIAEPKSGAPVVQSPH